MTREMRAVDQRDKAGGGKKGNGALKYSRRRGEEKHMGWRGVRSHEERKRKKERKKESQGIYE